MKLADELKTEAFDVFCDQFRDIVGRRNMRGFTSAALTYPLELRPRIERFLLEGGFEVDWDSEPKTPWECEFFGARNRESVCGFVRVRWA